ncbi:response regulator [bacterium]|nr:response regulator [bacterium]
MAGRLLIVDDSALNRHLVTALMRSMGVEVREADSGAAALAKLREEPVDLILSDIRMPGMDGLAFLAKVKAETSLAQIPIIMVSSLDDRDAELRSLEAGAQDYIHKPYEPSLLKIRVNAWLERKRQSEELASQLAALEKSNAELQTTARKQASNLLLDPTNGWLTRRAGLTSLQKLTAAAERFHQPLSCLLVQLNPEPATIQVASDVINASLRASDWASRYDAQQLLVMCPNTAIDQALNLARRWLGLLEARLQNLSPQARKISIGLSQWSTGCDLINDLDRALREAASQPGSQCQVSRPPDPSQPPPRWSPT